MKIKEIIKAYDILKSPWNELSVKVKVQESTEAITIILTKNKHGEYMWSFKNKDSRSVEKFASKYKFKRDLYNFVDDEINELCEVKEIIQLDEY